MEEGILMTKRDLRRLKVIEQVLEKGLKQKQAAEALELSTRQIKRIVGRVRKEGAKGIIHRLRGKRSNRKHSEELKQKVLKLFTEKYEGFGPTLAQEKLEERNRIKINRETLRQWMLHEGLWQSQRKSSKHRQWRERKDSFGQMIQIDGSHHDWLEARGPKLVLMGYIDDATGHVFGRFYDYEGTVPALDSFHHYARCYGLPHSVYMDRHSTYKGSSRKLTIEEELAGKEESLSEFGRAMEELGVKLIHAQSPQAKGRIERLFKTFQDRLIKEMRLEGIKTLEEANLFLEKYLPIYNRRFDRKPKSEGNLHRKPPKNLGEILSIQTKRFLREDNTIRHTNQFYQILSRWPGRRPKEVTVQERLNGMLYLVHEGRELKYHPIQAPPKRFSIHKKKPSNARRPQAPPMTHPFKRRSFENYQRKLQVKIAA